MMNMEGEYEDENEDEDEDEPFLLYYGRRFVVCGIH